MRFDELYDFPLKEVHPVPRGLLGPGAYEMVGEEAKKAGITRALLVSTGLRGTGLVDDIKGKLEHAGVGVSVYDKVESNPKDYNVHDGEKQYREEKCDGVVSIGGGSTTDCAKGIRMVLANDGRNINEFEGMNASQAPSNPPHIAINSTTGTGSETSWAYVITDTRDPDNPRKWAAFDHTCIVNCSINDPFVIKSLPQDLTAFCGFDVLAHASEPYLSRLDVPSSHGQAYWGVKLTAEWLRRSVANPADIEARTGMMWAEYIGAQAFNSGGLGIIHSVSHAVSAFYDTHHGLGNAIALPRVWEWNLPVHYKRFGELATAMGENTHGLSDIEAADRALDAVYRLSRDCRIPENFQAVGDYSKSRFGKGAYEKVGNHISDDDDNCQRIAAHILRDVCTPGNPQECTMENLQPVVRACISGALH